MYMYMYIHMSTHMCIYPYVCICVLITETIIIDLPLCQTMLIIDLTSWSLSHFTKHIQLNPLHSLLILWSDNLSDHTYYCLTNMILVLVNVWCHTVIIVSWCGTKMLIGYLSQLRMYIRMYLPTYVHTYIHYVILHSCTYTFILIVKDCVCVCVCVFTIWYDAYAYICDACMLGHLQHKHMLTYKHMLTTQTYAYV